MRRHRRGRGRGSSRGPAAPPFEDQSTKAEVFETGLKAIDLHYTGGMRLPLARYLDISAPWQPYRTVATWYLWRSLDPLPVEY
ncbi:MAG: hypothetical protein BWX69_01835 [Planctomycetes bacterium ADurb.Bin069]|nr:MAG: hypothetical protein BWX69_01835 [Planctomycetes bacterium ADurb.Bin069]